MQLVNPEPRQVNTCDGSSSVSPNISNYVMQKYDVACLVIILYFENSV